MRGKKLNFLYLLSIQEKWRNTIGDVVDQWKKDTTPYVHAWCFFFFLGGGMVFDHFKQPSCLFFLVGEGRGGVVI